MISQDMSEYLERSMTKLHLIWDRIGMGKSAKDTRTLQAVTHVQALMDEMIEEEAALERELEKKIADYVTKLARLAQELHLPEYQPQNNLKPLHLERDLRMKLETWNSEREERLRVLGRLQLDDQKLCDALCVTPYYIPSGSIPSGEQLDKLKEHIQSLANEKEKRFGTFIKQKKEVIDLMLLMERSAETSFEKELVNDDDEAFTLSSENMQRLNSLLKELLSYKADLEMMVSGLWDRLQLLWERLEVPEKTQQKFREGKQGFKPSVVQAIQEEVDRCEALKLSHLEKFVEGMRTELREWWDKCYYSDQQRGQFKHMFDSPGELTTVNSNAASLNMFDTKYTEELLQKHEVEVARVKEFYTTYKHILQLVERREALFKQMVEFEKRAHDPNRFFSDRGGKLLLEEKERKSLMKQLPKVEQSVKEDIASWEKEHGRTFLVNGMSFIKYIEKTWMDFEEEKIREKAERQKAKTRLMNEEMIYGSKPSTPVKRRFPAANTPSKTPKYRKINESRTPSHHSTMISSQCMRTPLSTSKVPQASKIMSANSKSVPGSRNRRRSKRLSRKALKDYNAGTNESLFSQTTVSTDTNNIAADGGNISLASTGSYRDFATGLNPSTRPYCRSSVAPPPQSPRAKLDLFRL